MTPVVGPEQAGAFNAMMEYVVSHSQPPSELPWKKVQAGDEVEVLGSGYMAGNSIRSEITVSARLFTPAVIEVLRFIVSPVVPRKRKKVSAGRGVGQG